MTDNRQELLKELIEKFTEVAHNMHSNQSFPFGKFMLGRQQLMLLFFVFEKKGLVSVKEIAKLLRVTPGAVTQFVNALVDKGLVRREESLVDHRSVNIKLTISAEKRFNDFKKMYLVNASKAFVGLNEKELRQLVLLLGKIKKISD